MVHLALLCPLALFITPCAGAAGLRPYRCGSLCGRDDHIHLWRMQDDVVSLSDCLRRRLCRPGNDDGTRAVCHAAMWLLPAASPDVQRHGYPPGRSVPPARQRDQAAARVDGERVLAHHLSEFDHRFAFSTSAATVVRLPKIVSAAAARTGGGPISAACPADRARPWQLAVLSLLYM